MAPTAPRLRILSVGGNAVSAFLSWRLQATNACDVTLVWKAGYDEVNKYGISMKSPTFGNERFIPRHVVKTPEEASGLKDGAFDYVLLCVKALPDVYDLASIIETVVTPQHTCILVNTTTTLGIEAHLEQRFPTNVVLSLVSGAELIQTGISEFEHVTSTEVWVGPANKNPSIPSSIQQDMAEALAMTLSTGQVDCRVSANIRQQQYEHTIGPIAFQPLSVLLETPSHIELVEKVGVKAMVSDIIDELMSIAIAQECTFPDNFKNTVMADMLKPNMPNSIMYQDFMARRPMEVETCLGSPIKLAQSVNVKVPRIESLYAILHHVNISNQEKKNAPAAGPMATPTNGFAPPPRLSSAPQPRPPMYGVNGNPMGRGRGRAPSMGPHPGMGPRRGGAMNGGPNGFGRPMPNGYGPPPSRGGGPQSRRGSMDGNDLEEFSHLMLYDDIPEGSEPGYAEGSDLALRERELMLRQRELALREQEMRMQRGGPGPRRGPAPSVRGGYDDEDEEDGEYFDPNAPVQPMIDPDNFDMMSVTSKRNRKAPGNARDIRRNPEFMNGPRGNGMFGRPSYNRNRSSARLINQSIPPDNTSIMDDPLMGYSSNRYGTVDRSNLGRESRTNSLTSARLDELQYGGAPNGQSGPYPRRASQSPGNPYSPAMARANGRPSPPNGYMNGNGNGRPSPPNGVRQPMPRYPPGQGNSVAPQEVEQHAGVSALNPQKSSMNVRSLTGSASASAGSGDSGASAHIDSENSAHSSQSSLGARPPIGVR